MYFIGAFSIAIVGYLFVLHFFKSVKQYEREEGLHSHKAKNGTPTLGGLFFCLPCLIFCFLYPQGLFVFLSSILFYLIGLLDDVLKLKRKQNLGLSSKTKLFLQITCGVIAGLLFYFTGDLDFKMIPFFIIVLAFVSSSNAYNLTDGCDGLLTVLTLIMGVAWCFIIYRSESYELLVAHVCLLGILTAFLYFNVSKAFIFMGDTGSLFLGAYYCALAVYLNAIPLFILMSGLIIFETVSVIIQVFYFKISKGKRIFKMAPFHHHLEASQMSEVMVNLTFILLEVILVFVSLVVGGYL